MAQQPPTSAAPVPGCCQPGEPGRAVPLTPVTIKPIANAAMVAPNHETPSSTDTTQAPGEDGRACRAPLSGVGSCSAMSLIMTYCRADGPGAAVNSGGATVGPGGYSAPA
jgi:hypothetical protein